MANPTSPQPITTTSNANGGPMLVESTYERFGTKYLLVELAAQ